MTDLLRDYERKRLRAMDHFNVLFQMVEGFSDRNRPPVHGQLQRDSSKHVFNVPLERIDPALALVLGDFIYNTRASLDYLVTALVRSTSEEENDASQFPIYTPVSVGWENINEWWDNSNQVRRKLKDTPPGTQAALKTLQSFYGIPATGWFRHPLTVLAALSNRDKHRRLNLLARRASIDFVDADGSHCSSTGRPSTT